MAKQPPVNVMDQLIENSIISMHAYGEDEIELPPQWECIATSKDLMPHAKTGFKGAVYRFAPPPGEERFAIAFCGFKNAGDIKSVLAAGLSGLPDQTPEALEFTILATQKFDILTSRLNFVGHSLGGYLAKSVGKIWGAQDVTPINSPGFKPGDAEKLDRLAKLMDILPCKTEPKITGVNSKNDLIGMWGEPSGQLYEVDTQGSHHGIANMVQTLATVHKASAAFSQVCGKTPKPNPIRAVLGRVCAKLGESERVQNTIKGHFRTPSTTAPTTKITS